MLLIAQAFRQGHSLNDIQNASHYDPWFLDQIEAIVAVEEKVRITGLPTEAPGLLALKKMGFSDDRLGELTGQGAASVTAARRKMDIAPAFKRVDTCAAEFAADPTRIITVNAMYMNGFEHVGVTMLDTLDALFGAPGAVYVYNAVINLENNQLTYEFVLYYDNFNITVKTVDSSIHAYNYHIFDIDIFLADGRLTLNQTGRWLERRTVGDYAYSGVSVFEEDSKRSEKTGWDKSMIAAVDYIARVTRGGAHTINTPAQSQRTRRILDAIIKSAETETKINVNEIS